MKVLLLGLFLISTFAGADLPPLVQLRDAAEKGDPKAQVTLADRYAGAFNYSEAERLYRLAAMHGDPEVLLKLGHFYIDGKPKLHGAAPVVQNVTNAIALYTLAAVLGHAQAQYTLGVIYWQGRHTKQDRIKAYQLFRTSEKYLASKLMLDRIILQLSREEIEKGEVLARQFQRVTFKDALRIAVEKALRVRGVTILPNYKSAWINNYTVAEGKQFEIPVSGLSVTFLCEKVAEKTVTLRMLHNSEQLLLPVVGR